MESFCIVHHFAYNKYTYQLNNKFNIISLLTISAENTLRRFINNKTYSGFKRDYYMQIENLKKTQNC